MTTDTLQWPVIACAALIAVLGIWILVKLLKLAFWLLLVAGLLAAGAAAVWILLGN